MDCKIATVNVQGWRRKRPLVENLVLTDSIHILSVTETRLRPAQPLSIPGFSVFRRDDPGGVYGVALAFHHRLPATELELPDEHRHLHCCAATLHTDGIPTDIFSIYIPPGDDLPVDFLEYVATLRRAVVLGDFNSRHTAFGDVVCNPKGRILSNCLLRLPLYRIPNYKPTFLNHNGSSVIDHIIITDNLTPRFSDDPEIGTSITSDHLPLITATDIAVAPPRAVTLVSYRDWKRAEWDRFREIIEADLADVLAPTTADELDATVNRLTASIQDGIDAAVPMKTFDTFRPPLPQPVLRLIREKRRLYREFIRTRDPVIKAQWNRHNALVRLQTTRFREARWANFCSGMDHRKGAQFWRKLRTVTGQRNPAHNHLRVQGRVVSDPLEQAEVFADTLEQVHQVPMDDRFNEYQLRQTNNRIHRHPDIAPLFQIPQAPLPDQEPDVPVPDILKPVEEEEVHDAIASGKNTAPGEDSIPRKALRQLPAAAILLLTSIFNSCLRSGNFPAPWKTAAVIMIHKPRKSRSNPANYRPIALLNVLGKVFERILADRFRRYLDDRRLLPDFQFGFRPGRSANDLLLRLHTDASVALNQGHCMAAVFLDIERAFDSVWHEGLLEKLLDAGLPTPFVRLVRGFLEGRRHSVRVARQASRPFTLRAGVPQGSILSPILYIFFCSDIPLPRNPSVRLLQYADDTALWMPASSSASASRHLSAALASLEQWFLRWRVKPNPAKTQTILFRHPNLVSKRQIQPRDVDLTLWDEHLRLTPRITYLGVTFGYTLSGKEELRRCLDLVQQRSGILSRLLGGLRGCHPRTLIHTYKTFIRPVIDYRFTIFSSLPRYEVESIRRKERAVARRMMRLDRFHPSGEVCVMAGIPPIDARLSGLRGRYVARAVEHNVDHALETLRTPIRPRRKPKRKLKHPPAVLLGDAEELPQDLEDLLEGFPLAIR